MTDKFYRPVRRKRGWSQGFIISLIMIFSVVTTLAVSIYISSLSDVSYGDIAVREANVLRINTIVHIHTKGRGK